MEGKELRRRVDRVDGKYLSARHYTSRKSASFCGGAVPGLTQPSRIDTCKSGEPAKRHPKRER